MTEFKVVNTTCKGHLVALELRLHDGQITPAMRQRLRLHDYVLRVFAGNNPTKLFVLTCVANHARKGKLRDDFVDSLSKFATA